LIEKLKVHNKDDWQNWTEDEKRQLLEIYWVISKKEHHIFKLIYHYHGGDSWGDIFRDYDIEYLKDKTNGVKMALDEITRRIKRDV